MRRKKEVSVLVLLCRQTFIEEEIDRLKALCKDVNWFEIFKLGAYHKTISLMWKNILRLNIKTNLPSYLFNLGNFVYESTKKCNEMYEKEQKKVCQYLADNGITILPVKGITLLNEIYHDKGVRYMGDIDCLVRREDTDKLEKLMHDIEYKIGYFSFHNSSVIEYSRAEKIKWQVGMSNLYPFVKQTGNNICPFYKFDFRHSLMDDLVGSAVDDMIIKFEQKGKMDYVHKIVHLCTHFYNEAKHISTINAAKDLNIVKLCDIRETILVSEKILNYSYFKEFVKKHKLEKAIYYTMYYLKIVYNDGYEDKLMKMFNITDDSFMNTYGRTTNFENNIFALTPEERLFLEK